MATILTEKIDGRKRNQEWKPLREEDVGCSIMLRSRLFTLSIANIYTSVENGRALGKLFFPELSGKDIGLA